MVLFVSGIFSHHFEGLIFSADEPKQKHQTHIPDAPLFSKRRRMTVTSDGMGIFGSRKRLPQRYDLPKQSEPQADPSNFFVDRNNHETHRVHTKEHMNPLVHRSTIPRLGTYRKFGHEKQGFVWFGSGSVKSGHFWNFLHLEPRRLKAGPHPVFLLGLYGNMSISSSSFCCKQALEVPAVFFFRSVKIESWVELSYCNCNYSGTSGGVWKTFGNVFYKAKLRCLQPGNWLFPTERTWTSRGRNVTSDLQKWHIPWNAIQLQT